jgi:hypothetical protein
VCEGLVERRAASGTYIPGDADATATGAFTETWLILSGRARRPNSSGSGFWRAVPTPPTRRDVLAGCWSENIGGRRPSSVRFPGFMGVTERSRHLPTRGTAGATPQCPLSRAWRAHGSIASRWTMPSAGACAADLLIGTGEGNGAGFSVVTGPVGDPRSDARREGFYPAHPMQSLFRPGWYTEDGVRVASDALRYGPRGIFCANDRLGKVSSSRANATECRARVLSASTTPGRGPLAI